MQAEAERVSATGLLPILQAFHREKLAMRQRHVAVARQIGDYEFNNTYQYVVNREDVHVSWLEAAINELGGTAEDVGEPSPPSTGRNQKNDFLSLVAEDSRGAQAFVSHWRTRLVDVVNARHRSMLQVILGETLEQKRFFDLMLAGRDDLLGRRSNGPGSTGTGDGVLPVRWMG